MPKLLPDDSHLRNLAAALGLAYLLPLGQNPYASVFKARSRGGKAVAVKCMTLDEGEDAEAHSKKNRRAQKERDMAHWAADQGLGPPILKHVMLPLASCLVMPCAEVDLQVFWRRQARASSLAVTRTLWRDAFDLVSAPQLCEGCWIGADLKPANFLLYRMSSGYQICLNDFDACFWRRASSSQVASLINTIVLLSNALFLLPLPLLVPHLPDAIIDVLHRLLSEDPSLLAVLKDNMPWLRRGLLHYSRASNLEQHLMLLRQRATAHGHMLGFALR